MSINSDKEHLLRLQTARKATIEGFIKLIDLEYFLACDTSLSSDTLTKINRVFHVGWNDQNGSWSKESRHGFWLWMLLRISGLRGKIFKSKLPDIGAYLPVYEYDRISGEYIRISAGNASADWFDKAYICLEEFSQYIKKIETVYQISILVPEEFKSTHPQKPNLKHKGKANTLGVPEGTIWGEVTIEVIDNEHVRIKAPNVDKTVHYFGIGMAHGKSTKADGSWALLKLIAEKEKISSQENVGENSKTLSKRIERLDKKLQNAFGITYKAFTDYRTARKYAPNFRLIDRRDPDALSSKAEAEGDVSLFEEEVNDKKKTIYPSPQKR